MPLKLIVGLGNPGPQYINTRHNAGAWFVEKFLKKHHINAKLESKFSARTASLDNCWLFLPTTFMNLSGRAIAAFVHYYNIAPEEVLIVHDELDFEPGIVRLKQNGGHGGHNGLRSIIDSLSQQKNFWRLRIGIGHPGDKDEVADYVLHTPSKDQKIAIDIAIQQALDLLPEMLNSDLNKAMNLLNAQSP